MSSHSVSTLRQELKRSRAQDSDNKEMRRVHNHSCSTEYYIQGGVSNLKEDKAGKCRTQQKSLCTGEEGKHESI